MINSACSFDLFADTDCGIATSGIDSVFVRDYLNAESYTGLFLFLYFVSGAALMQLWFVLSKRLDKYRAWLVSMLLSLVYLFGLFC